MPDCFESAARKKGPKDYAKGGGVTLAHSGRVTLLMAFAMTVGRVDFFIEDAEEMTTSVVKIRNDMKILCICREYMGK